MRTKLLKAFFALCVFMISSVTASSTVEIRGAAFVPVSSKFRDAYQDVGPNYQVEVASQIDCCWPVELWTNFDWYSKTRKHECYKTRVQIPTVSSGLKYMFQTLCFCPDLKFYAGLGISFSRVYLKNESCCTENDKTSKFSVGGVFKSGVYYEFCENFFLDVFADYFYQPVCFHKHVDVGGLKVGAGIGIRF